MNRVNLICKDITGLEQLDKAAMLVDKTVQVPVNIFIPEFARKNLFSSQWRGTLLFLSTNMAAVKSAMQFRIPTTISRVQRKSVLQLCYLGCCNQHVIECFQMTSRRPYWCPKTMKRRPCWCPKPVLWELNSFLMQTLSFVPINLHIQPNCLKSF